MDDHCVISHRSLPTTLATQMQQQLMWIWCAIDSAMYHTHGLCVSNGSMICSGMHQHHTEAQHNRNQECAMYAAAKCDPHLQYICTHICIYTHTHIYTYIYIYVCVCGHLQMGARMWCGTVVGQHWVNDWVGCGGVGHNMNSITDGCHACAAPCLCQTDWIHDMSCWCVVLFMQGCIWEHIMCCNVTKWCILWAHAWYTHPPKSAYNTNRWACAANKKNHQSIAHMPNIQGVMQAWAHTTPSTWCYTCTMVGAPLPSCMLTVLDCCTSLSLMCYPCSGESCATIMNSIPATPNTAQWHAL